MLKIFLRLIKKSAVALKRLLPHLWYGFVRYWQRNIWHKLITIVIGFALLCLGAMYGIARWYIAGESHKSLEMGVTFIPSYAQYLGLDPQTTFRAILSDLHPKQVRLVGYWSDIEATKGQYDFVELDSEFQQAQMTGTKISLSIGLRQPRWPECHMPDWAKNEPVNTWQPQLEQFMGQVINRYKNSSALESYQLENEFFNQFGDCHNLDRSRLVHEFNFVKKADSKHPTIISRSNNWGGLPLGKPTPDIFGVSIYRRVWEPHVKRYVQYPFPAWYYGFLAGAQKLTTGKDSIIHEMQAEPWPPDGKNITDINLAEQNKSFNAKRFKQLIAFSKGTGMRTIDFWGAEYWYYRMVTLHDPSVWNVAKEAFDANN